MKRSLEHATFLSVLQAANALTQEVAEVLKPAGLTPTQYNVLRILKGAGSGLACGEMGERLIARDPDVTRLLDRLERRGLIKRTRSTEDRRVVVTEITEEGEAILGELQEPVDRLHRAQFRHMGKEKLSTLFQLLEEARTSG